MKSKAQLEKSIFKNPDDATAHRAYADWLTQQGDPRGEFIRVQLELERSRTARSRTEQTGSTPPGDAEKNMVATGSVTLRRSCWINTDWLKFVPGWSGAPARRHGKENTSLTLGEAGSRNFTYPR